MNSRVVLLLLLLKYSAAQDANCNFYLAVSVGTTYYINNPNYPNNYRPGVQCRWIARCPAGYNCRIDCPEIRLPQSQGCMLDRLMVWKTGAPQLNSAEKYCGTGSLTAVSTAQTITVVLITRTSSPGGTFQCSLVAQPVNPPTPCSCGVRRQNRILGVVKTGIDEFTMLAGLADIKIRKIKCGGVIISSKFIVSAAHCVVNQSVNNYAVVAGEHDVSTGADTDTAKAYAIEEFIIHPSFSSSNYDNDIALVKVVQDIVFGARVGPVCLPFSQVNNNFTGSKVTVVGLGTTSLGLPLKADLEVLSQSTCLSRGTPVTDRQMCTSNSRKDATCLEDSGVPVVWTNPNNGLLYSVGIMSYGTFCASSTPGISTRVTSFLNWIRQNAPADYCVK